MKPFDANFIRHCIIGNTDSKEDERRLLEAFDTAIAAEDKLSSAENAIALYKLAITSESPEASLMEENRQLSSRLEHLQRLLVSSEGHLENKHNALIAAENRLEQLQSHREQAYQELADISAENGTLRSRLSSEINRAEIAEARLRNVIGWRENDWPEWFDRRTASVVAQLASPDSETVDRRRSETSPNGPVEGFKALFEAMSPEMRKRVLEGDWPTDVERRVLVVDDAPYNREPRE